MLASSAVIGGGLYAIGVLQVEVDNRGGVRNLNWMRAPRHAPEVVAEIERTAREGLLMPPKSTFFTPKLKTGFVIRPLA